MSGRGPDEPRPGDADGPDGSADDHVDPITEIEAEVDAELPDLDVEVIHVPHRHREPTVAPDTIGTTGPPPNPHADRQRFLVAYLRVALLLAFLIGVLELALPEDLRDEAATVMVAVFVVAPLGRIVWLMIRWARRGDWRFAAVGVALLSVVAVGFLAR